MLHWAFMSFFIAALFGFTSIAGAAAGIAKIMFYVFVVLLAISLLSGALRSRAPKS